MAGAIKTSQPPQANPAYKAPAQPTGLPAAASQQNAQPAPVNPAGSPPPQPGNPATAQQGYPQQRAPLPDNGTAVPQRGLSAQVQGQQPAQTGSIPQNVSASPTGLGQGIPIPPRSPGSDFQFEVIARQIGERLKIQVNENIDRLVEELAEDLKKSLAKIPNPELLSKNLQKLNPSLEPQPGTPQKSIVSFFSRIKIGKKAKEASPQRERGKKPGFFGRFSKKKAASSKQQSNLSVPNYIQPLYPPPIQRRQMNPAPQAQQPAYSQPQPQPQQRPYPQPQPQAPQQGYPQSCPQPKQQQPVNPLSRPQTQPQQPYPRLQSQPQQPYPQLQPQTQKRQAYPQPQPLAPNQMPQQMRKK
jgi:hypothetical protein